MIEAYINENRYLYECMEHPEKMFFFSKREVNDKIVVGDGSEGDHFNVCMTSLALLKN